MLIGLFQEVRKAGIPASLRELLDLHAALEQHLAFADMDDFYYLSRLCLVKDEKYFDRFDMAFSVYFQGLQDLNDVLAKVIPDEWLRREFERQLSEEERQRIDSLGGLDELLKQFKKRLEEQNERHQGGNKWIGTGGTSPFGAYGYNPEGIRIGQDRNRNRRAIKVWDRREFRNLDDSVELGTRNIKVALKRLREFARSGADEELDLDNTISATARNAGFLDLKMRPEKHNAVKVLLLMDIGGSMDDYVRSCEELFSAARSEFKHLEYFYFHNFIYENVWRDNRRRRTEVTQTFDLLHKYGRDYKVIFVGDATMSPYEIAYPGGSVEHMNEEAGSVWFERFSDTFDKLVWLNPTPREQWEHIQSVAMTRELCGDRMHPMTLEGLESAMRYLSN
ncbi:VWA domain-containing protein [Granulosicoccaceae sp. 1_MG-2023]|nr:VWA domain-containing protein [Granulosicoccaceae sp. 1_MG-2023]